MSATATMPMRAVTVPINGYDVTIVRMANGVAPIPEHVNSIRATLSATVRGHIVTADTTGYTIARVTDAGHAIRTVRDQQVSPLTHLQRAMVWLS